MGYSSLGNPFLHAAEAAYLDAARELLEDWDTRESPQLPATEPELQRRRVTPDVRRRIIERDGFACQRCGAEDDLQVDHIIPISRSGTSDDDNLQVLCAPCNRSKGAKTLAEWGGRQ